MTWLFFCKLLMCVPYFCHKKHSLPMNGHDFGLCGLSHRKHFALWFLDGVFCPIFETVSFGCLHSFRIAAACFIADSRDSEMSMTFSKDKFAFSLNKLCCVRSWFIPHTKRSLKIESKESLYSQYWLSLLSLLWCTVFLFHMLNWNLSAIGFLFGFWWFAIKVANSSNVFSTGFAGAVSPLNNWCVPIPQDVKRIAFFANRQRRLP